MGYTPRSEAQKPYDTSLEDGNNRSMYDKLPYQRNADMCNASTLALNSGNLVKYYRCNPAAEAKEIDTQDTHFSEIVHAHIQAHERYEQDMHSHFPTLFPGLGAMPDFDTDEEEESEE